MAKIIDWFNENIKTPLAVWFLEKFIPVKYLNGFKTIIGQLVIFLTALVAFIQATWEQLNIMFPEYVGTKPFAVEILTLIIAYLTGDVLTKLGKWHREVKSSR